MSGLRINDKDIVVPGEELADGMDYLPSYGTYRDNEKIISSLYGLVNISGRVIRIVALRGKYIPKVSDVVIGRIRNVGFSGWSVDVGYAYDANLSMKDASSEYIERSSDLSQYYAIDDIIVAKVVNVTKSKFIDVTLKGPGLKKLKDGRIIEVTPSKVPRIIGKQGSMISMIKTACNCDIIVGQNGKIWIYGKPEDEMLAIDVINMVDREAHREGLTDKIKGYLEKKKK